MHGFDVNHLTDANRYNAVEAQLQLVVTQRMPMYDARVK